MHNRTLGLAVLLVLIPQVLQASPTGLNNIPTTDVTGDKVLVLQAWQTTGHDAKPLYMTGFKYGILDKAEVGLDSKVGSGDAGPLAFQAKFKVLKLDSGFSALLGIEGMTTDDDFKDDITPYVAVSQDIKLFRLHAGYGFQNDNFGAFGGADKTFKIYKQDFVLRSDLKQTNDGDALLISGGFLLTLPLNLVLESCLSIPTESKAEESVTVKLNYVVTF